jgi:hypothetical protein
MATKKAQTKTVLVSDPAHPKHKSVWGAVLNALAVATAVGPAVVEIVAPDQADTARKAGAISDAVLTKVRKR